MTAPETAPPAAVRVDKWLWAVRLFPTRRAATAACLGGHVRVGEAVAKPARTVRPGEIVSAFNGHVRRTFRVLIASERRVGPALVPTLAADLTPPAEREHERLTQAQRILGRPRGAGRPTKRDRRQIDELLG